MDDLPIHDENAHNIGYFPFMDRDENTVFFIKGFLDSDVGGHLVLTNKKLFFFYWSNVNREKKFIATYPYIDSVKIKTGIFSAALNIGNKKDIFIISKIKKKDALKLFELLNRIITGNSL